VAAGWLTQGALRENGSRFLQDKCSIPTMLCSSHVQPIVSHTNPNKASWSIQNTCQFSSLWVG